MVGMSTYNEALHPRGNAKNAGQFATKTNDAPATTLADDSTARLDAIAHEHHRAEWAARLEVEAWNKRVREASVEQFYALAAAHAPAGATHALFTTDDGTVQLVGWQNLGGDELDEEPFGGHELVGFDTSDGDQLRDAGFELDEERWRWELGLREPAEPRALPERSENAPSQAHYIDARAHGDGALGSFLAGVARRAPGVGEKFDDLTDQQVASLNRDFEAFAALVATKIRNGQEG